MLPLPLSAEMDYGTAKDSKIFYDQISTSSWAKERGLPINPRRLLILYQSCSLHSLEINGPGVRSYCP